MNWTLIGVIVSIAGIPLTLIVLYLQAIRHQQDDLAQCLRRIERDYTTKREWEREQRHLRSQIDRLTGMVTELATRIRTDQGWLAQTERDRRRLIVMNQRIADLTRKTVPA